MVPYLSETSARNSWGVTALGRRWMEPARTGSSTWLARIQGLLTTAAPAPSRIHLAQDPGSESEHITRCARAAPQNLQEGVFLGGKISLSGSAPAQGIEQPHVQHGALQIHGQVATSSPPLVQAAAVALAQGGQTLGGHSELHPGRCCFPFQAGSALSVVSRHTPPSPHLCFITSFPATGSLQTGLVSSCSLHCSCIFCSCFCSGSLPEG